MPAPLRDRFATFAQILDGGILRRCVILSDDGELAVVRLLGEERVIACSHRDLFEFPGMP